MNGSRSLARIACATVRVEPGDDVHDLLGSVAPGDVFTARERRHCTGASIERLAGRLAAKRALLQLLALAPSTPMTELEIVPGGHPGTDRPCGGSHRPEVVLVGTAAAAAAGRPISVSISHARTLAVAVCAIADETEGAP